MNQERVVELQTIFHEHAPIVRHFGMRLSFTAEGNAVVDLPYNPDLDQGLSIIHGGVYATMLDTAGWFTSALARDIATGLATSEITVHFLRVAKQTSLQAVAKIIKQGKRQDVVEMHLYDDQQKLVGHGVGTFVVL